MYILNNVLHGKIIMKNIQEKATQPFYYLSFNNRTLGLIKKDAPTAEDMLAAKALVSLGKVRTAVSTDTNTKQPVSR